MKHHHNWLTKDLDYDKSCARISDHDNRLLINTQNSNYDVGLNRSYFFAVAFLMDRN